MAQQIRFYLNGQLQAVELEDLTRPVLAVLRYDLRLTGTKEGCAEGDCGACTIVVGRLEGDRLAYRAVNACILFLPELDGADVWTVEGLESLAGEDGALHPIQQDLVTCHGSQCGFCTPGFVMAYFGHYLKSGPYDRQSLKDVIAGNLCRCTGYGPILAAGEKMAAIPEGLAPDPDTVRERLAHLKRRETLSLHSVDPIGGRDMRYYAPTCVDDLAEILAQWPDATLLAGGTDVGLWVTKQHRRLGTVVSLNAIDALQRIDEDDQWLSAGACVRHSDIMARLSTLYPDMEDLMRRFGSVQVRNSGTLGGNIANGSPIGDSMPPLIALGSEIVLRKGDKRRRIALEDFYLDYGRQDREPGEFVERILIPKPVKERVLRCFKISKRFDQDISAVCAAFSYDVKEGVVRHIRIAFGGMAAIPKRAKHTEAALQGRRWDAKVLEEASAAIAQDFQPISDMRAGAGYRLQVAQNLLRKVWLDAVEKQPFVRLSEPNLPAGKASHG